jgi:hypothetical protein
MKQYLDKVKTLTRNDEGFYDDEDYEIKASYFLNDYLICPIEVILGIFKMIRELKLKYQ